MTTQELLKLVVEALEEKKGNEIEVIRVADQTDLTEYFVLCTGTSSTQIKTLADEVAFKAKEAGETPLRTEGYQAGNWIAVDFGPIIVHVFHPEMREFYKLERLWAEGEKVDPSTL